MQVILKGRDQKPEDFPETLRKYLDKEKENETKQSVSPISGQYTAPVDALGQEKTETNRRS